MLAKITILSLIFSGSAYAAGSKCGESLKGTTLSNYSQPTIGYNANSSKALQANILKAKIIVEASREASEKHAAEYMLSNGVDLQNSLELSLFSNFVLGVRDRHLTMYGGGVPKIQIKQEPIEQKPAKEVSNKASQAAKLFGVSTDKTFASKPLYEPAFTSTEFPSSLKNAESMGLITLRGGKTFDDLEATLTPTEIEATIQQMSGLIYGGKTQVAYQHTQQILKLSKELNNDEQTIIGVEKNNSAKLEKLTQLANSIQNMNPIFANTQAYLVAVISGNAQFTQQGCEEANLADFKSLSEVLFDGSKNEDIWKQQTHEIAIAKIQSTKKPTFKELSSKEYEKLKTYYNLIYSTPLKIFESYGKTDIGFAIPSN